MKIGAILAAVLLAIAAVVGTYWMARSDSSGGSTISVNESTEPVPAKTGPHPKVVVEETVHDFGMMKMGDSGKHIFVIRNEGEAPLQLGQPRTTCQCTVSEAAKKAIPPGGEGTITLEWTPTAPTDVFDKGAVIRTNDPEMRELTLSVKGRVETLVLSEPPGTWNVGEVSGEKQIEVTGYVYSRLIEDLEVTSAESPNEYVSVELEPASADKLEEFDAKSGYQIRATLSPGMPVGRFDETLTVKTNVDDEDFAEMTMKIVGTRHGPIQILPTPGVKWNPASLAIDFGRFPASEGRSATISMFVSGLPEGEDLKFEAVDSSEPYVELQLSKDEDFGGAGRQRYELTFRVPPGSPAVTHRAKEAVKVNVDTNHPEARAMKFFVEFISTR